MIPLRKLYIKIIAEGNFLEKQGAKKIRDWGIVLFYILFIYVSLPFMPGLWEGFVRKVGSFADYTAAIILVIFGGFIVFYLISKQKDIRSFIWLAMLACVYAFGLSRLKLSIERIHFIEYGILSIFLFRVLRHSIKNKSIYLWSGVAVFGLGLIDEGIQYLLPNRVFDTRDVIVNGLAGILGLLLIGLCFQPELESLNGRNR